MTEPDRVGNVHHTLRAMMQLLLKHEDQLQSIAKQDCFIFSTTPGEAGIQPILLKETATWTQAMQSTTPPKEPLRLILVRTIFDTLIERVQKIANMDTNSAAWQQTISTQVILPDGSWPFLSWNHAKSKLEINQTKKSLPAMKTLMELLQEIRELLCQQSSVLRVQALKPPAGGGTIPWRMQIGLRETTLFDQLSRLTYSSTWQLLQMTTQPHNAKRTNIATTIQQQLNSNGTDRPHSKGKGKGKHKRSS